MDSAPTIPRESIRLLEIVMMTAAVIMESRISETPKLFVKTTPENVRL